MWSNGLRDSVFVFSDKEIAWLERYGDWVRKLAEGYAEPTTEKQKHFVKAVNGEVEAAEEWESLWLKYIKFQEKERHYGQLISDVKHLEQAKAGQQMTISKLYQTIENLKNENEYQKGLIKKLQDVLPNYDKPTKNIEIKNTGKSICSVCGGDGGAARQCYKCDGTGWVNA